MEVNIGVKIFKKRFFGNPRIEDNNENIQSNNQTKSYRSKYKQFEREKEKRQSINESNDDRIKEIIIEKKEIKTVQYQNQNNEESGDKEDKALASTSISKTEKQQNIEESNDNEEKANEEEELENVVQEVENEEKVEIAQIVKEENINGSFDDIEEKDKKKENSFIA